MNTNRQKSVTYREWQPPYCFAWLPLNHWICSRCSLGHLLYESSTLQVHKSLPLYEVKVISSSPGMKRNKTKLILNKRQRHRERIHSNIRWLCVKFIENKKCINHQLSDCYNRMNEWMHNTLTQSSCTYIHIDIVESTIWMSASSECEPSHKIKR